jgi:hypothetical protein
VLGYELDNFEFDSQKEQEKFIFSKNVQNFSGVNPVFSPKVNVGFPFRIKRPESGISPTQPST